MAPPILHSTLLGVVQKGIKIIKAVCQHYDENQQSSTKFQQLLHLFYNELHVQPTHRGDFVGNDVKKILDNIPVVLSILNGCPEQPIVQQYFAYLPLIVTLTSTTKVIAFTLYFYI